MRYRVKSNYSLNLSAQVFSYLFDCKCKMTSMNGNRYEDDDTTLPSHRGKQRPFKLVVRFPAVNKPSIDLLNQKCRYLSCSGGKLTLTFKWKEPVSLYKELFSIRFIILNLSAGLTGMAATWCSVNAKLSESQPPLIEPVWWRQTLGTDGSSDCHRHASGLLWFHKFTVFLHLNLYSDKTNYKQKRSTFFHKKENAMITI